MKNKLKEYLRKKRDINSKVIHLLEKENEYQNLIDIKNKLEKHLGKKTQKRRRS